MSPPESHRTSKQGGLISHLNILICLVAVICICFCLVCVVNCHGTLAEFIDSKELCIIGAVGVPIEERVKQCHTKSWKLVKFTNILSISITQHLSLFSCKKISMEFRFLKTKKKRRKRNNAITADSVFSNSLMMARTNRMCDLMVIVVVVAFKTSFVFIGSSHYRLLSHISNGISC